MKLTLAAGPRYLVMATLVITVASSCLTRNRSLAVDIAWLWLCAQVDEAVQWAVETTMATVQMSHASFVRKKSTSLPDFL